MTLIILKIVSIILFLLSISGNEFYIENLENQLSESENTFFILSSTGVSVESSSSGVYDSSSSGVYDSSSTGVSNNIEIDETIPSFKGSITITVEKEIIESQIIKELSFMTNIPKERFRIISIAYIQTQQSIKFSELFYIKKVIQFEILHVKDDSQPIPQEIFRKLLTSSGQDTTYFSNITSETFLQKCADESFKTDCNIPSRASKLWLIPVILTSSVILLSTVYKINSFKKNNVTVLARSYIIQTSKEKSDVNIETNIEMTIPSLPPIPLINKYVNEPILPVIETKNENTLKNNKKRLHTVMPGKYTTFNDLERSERAIKRNTKMLIPLEIPKFSRLPIYKDEESEDEDLSSSDYSSSSTTPIISNENSYMDSISYSSSISSEKNILTSIKPIK